MIRRQLELFEREHAALIADCDAAERAYDEAGRDEAEERYGDYLDLVETGTEELAALRDNFAATMDELGRRRVRAEFNRAVADAASPLRARDRRRVARTSCS